MQGNIVRAAKWLAAGMVGAALVSVVGFHPMVTGRVVRIEKPEQSAPPPSINQDSPARLPAPYRTPEQYDSPRRTITTYRSR